MCISVSRSYILDRYCVVGVAVMVLSVVYWGVWRVVLPWLFKYELVPEKTILKDGTIVTVVGSSVMHSCQNLYDFTFHLQYSHHKIR